MINLAGSREATQIAREELGVIGVIDTYHIDSELGLYLFVQAVRK